MNGSVKNAQQAFDLMFQLLSAVGTISGSVIVRRVEPSVPPITLPLIGATTYELRFTQATRKRSKDFMRELDLEKSVLDAISTTLIGEKVEVRFAGLATPVAVRMRFAGGWEVMYTIVPGMALEFVRGEDGYLNALSVTLLRYEGPEQQI